MLIESQKFSVSQIARVYGVPVSMIGGAGQQQPHVQHGGVPVDGLPPVFRLAVARPP